ncbi:hypothetical protein QQS21_007781 [Conoideocrella luteorostrata]|uniref:GTP-binding protein n=1 Tax=Conoideocrella luteorostrata TaxID=1105319 RepID=A0AAJ0CK20_9HYPO|nr:hypothetical protein QQS21_007781 [Conoideocrella luteorostrata]
MFPSSLTQVKELGARLFSRAHGYRGLIIGLDAAGKTTFLYQLKLPGESTTTIPTVGFNVEDVTSANGRKFTLWDIGGKSIYHAQGPRCDKARPLYRHYFPGTDVFFFMIDCTDFERFELVTVEIRAVVEYARDLEKKNMWLVLNKQDLLPARTRASVVQGLRDRLEKELSACSASFRIRIYGPSGFSSANSAQVVALLDEVAEALERAGPAPETTAAASPVTQTQPQLAGLLDRGELVKRIGDRIAQDVETADDFWDDFLHAEPLIWDHYSHLKAGYFTLIEGAARGLGVRKCADMFLGHLDTLQSRNRDRFSNTAHQ